MSSVCVLPATCKKRFSAELHVCNILCHYGLQDDETEEGEVPPDDAMQPSGQSDDSCGWKPSSTVTNATISDMVLASLQAYLDVSSMLQSVKAGLAYNMRLSSALDICDATS